MELCFIIPAADAALTPLVLIEIVGYDRLNSSVGFMCMFRGFPILIAGPIGGKLTDCVDFLIYMSHIQLNDCFVYNIIKY